MAFHRGAIAIERFVAAGQASRKTRPVVVVSNDVANRFSGALTVVFVTQWDEHKAKLPVTVELPKGVAGATKRSIVHCGQIHTLQRQFLHETKSSVPAALLEQIDEALRRHLSLR
jgi:mRNA-degrading endonuclease toxin of MazEF toxin-antitoxin module